MKFYEIRPVEGNAFERHYSHLPEGLQVILYWFYRRIVSFWYFIRQHCYRHCPEESYIQIHLLIDGTNKYYLNQPTEGWSPHRQGEMFINLAKEEEISLSLVKLDIHPNLRIDKAVWPWCFNIRFALEKHGFVLTEIFIFKIAVEFRLSSQRSAFAVLLLYVLCYIFVSSVSLRSTWDRERGSVSREWRGYQGAPTYGSSHYEPSPDHFKCASGAFGMLWFFWLAGAPSSWDYGFLRTKHELRSSYWFAPRR